MTREEAELAREAEAAYQAAYAAGYAEGALLRVRRLRALVHRARAALDAASAAMDACAREIAAMPERHADTPWRAIVRTDDDGRVHRLGYQPCPPGAVKYHYYFVPSENSDGRWVLAMGALGDDAPANLELGERALRVWCRWEHCAIRVNALRAAYEREFREAVEM